MPSISLPKGGGAIRGIGEKFTANPVTGTGSLNVPIFKSPGRSGFGPQLSLSYDSGSGNGPFGLGWSLSLPSITRKTDKSLPKYDDTNESDDVFILSGAEDLVPVLVQISGRWRSDINTRVVNAVNYRIQRYRPRIEGLFARLERWTNLQSGETHWRSISRDNITTLYGKTAESRIADPTDRRRIFSWLICESYDDKGNAMTYQYKQENSQGVDISSVHERNRTDDPISVNSRHVNRYLKRIKYGNRSPYRKGDDLSNHDTEDWMFEVVFDYGEHYSEDDNENPNYISVADDKRVWKIRQDPFSSYRASFEVRTYRLCQGVLMFHHFPTEFGVNDYLVRSTTFKYSSSPIASFITSITQSGYLRKADGTYLKKSIPPLEFSYSEAKIQKKVEEVNAESLENLPYGLDGTNYKWVDLDGEGLPGLLTEQGGAWFYKANLSSLPVSDTEGKPSTLTRFAPMRLVTKIPSLNHQGQSKKELLDLAGDGQVDLVLFNNPISGFFERVVTDGNAQDGNENSHDSGIDTKVQSTQERTWNTFVPFSSLPNVDWNDANLRFIDLTGDGHADILVSEDIAFTWYPSMAEKGFGQGIKNVSKSFDEEKGPRLVFADGTQSIYLSDMSGDGLTDLVRIRNGEICYWPNLGYGRFGAKVTMNNSPWFDNPDQFDLRCVRLADIDGSGVTDIIYLGRDAIYIYFNQSGNSWTIRENNNEEKAISTFPKIDNLSTVIALDLLGNGTGCLVWSSPLAKNAGAPMRYIKLMGDQKPHLMVHFKNNLGAETIINYAPSTKFYLADKLAGKPWITALPFPVHVVEIVETRDNVSRNRLVSRYAYHHGYFDGIEREFRGFGMVEQWDTEAFEDYVVGVERFEGGQELAPELNQPPVTTRTWFHIGALVGQETNLHELRSEYYRKEQHIPEPILPAGLNVQEWRECFRALKGLPLRQEIYSFDGSGQEQYPYHVIENNYEIKLLQPRGEQDPAVFFPFGCESVSVNYERNPADPRIAHGLNLEVDEYGNVLKSCSVVYGRKVMNPLLPAEVTRDQRMAHITYKESDYTTDIIRDDPTPAYRMRVSYESRSYEITGIIPASSLFKLTEIKRQIAGAANIPYEIVADVATPQKRLLLHSRTLFLDNNLSPLPLGQWDSLGLIHESYQLAFTPGIIGTYYGGKITDADFSRRATSNSMAMPTGGYHLVQRFFLPAQPTISTFPSEWKTHWERKRSPPSTNTIWSSREL